MIYGVGIDIVRIHRIQDAVERWREKFLLRVYTSEEIAYCYKRKNPFSSLAARFAAKEAFIKAISHGIPLSFRDIEISNSDTGQPLLKLKGTLDDFVQTKLIKKIYLSLSHEQEYAVACVVLEC